MLLMPYLKTLSNYGIVTILRKRGLWFVHLQKKGKFGILSTGESIWEEDLNVAIKKLLLRLISSNPN